MADVADEIVVGLEELAKKLELGEPVKATQVQRVETPDGPMHLSTEVTLKKDDNG